MRKKPTSALNPPIREFADRGMQWVLVPENVRGLLLELSASLVPRIDFSQMASVPKSFIPADLRKQEADIIYRAPFRSQGQEREILIYILIEHQSTPDASMQFRLLSYMSSLWQMQRREFKRKKIPISQWRFYPIIPVVLYTGEERWNADLSLETLMEVPEELQSFVPRFEALMLRLNETSPEELTATRHPFGWLLRVLQKANAPSAELQRVIDEAVEQLMGLAAEDREGWSRLIYFIHLMLVHRRGPTEGPQISGRISERIARAGYREEAQMAQTWAQALIAEGMEVGMEKGRLEGRLEAMHSLLLELLAGKFGSVPEAVERRVRSIQEQSEITRLARQILTATSLVELNLLPH